jgi:hypothetical protein
MAESALLKQIARRGTDAGGIADKVIKNSRLLSEIFNGLSSDKARIRYGCDKVLRIVSEKDPEILYPKIDFFAKQLDGNDTFFKWSAIRIIANLAAVDSKARLKGSSVSILHLFPVRSCSRTRETLRGKRPKSL